MKWFDWVCITIVAGFSLLLVVEFFTTPGVAWTVLGILFFASTLAMMFFHEKQENDYYEMREEKRRQQVEKWRRGKK